MEAVYMLRIVTVIHLSLGNEFQLHFTVVASAPCCADWSCRIRPSRFATRVLQLARVDIVIALVVRWIAYFFCALCVFFLTFFITFIIVIPKRNCFKDFVNNINLITNYIFLQPWYILIVLKVPTGQPVIIALINIFLAEFFVRHAFFIVWQRKQRVLLLSILLSAVIQILELSLEVRLCFYSVTFLLTPAEQETSSRMAADLYRNQWR